jgi:hypothetical protein
VRLRSVVIAVLLLSAQAAIAQEDLERIFENPYVEQTNTLLDAWDAGELVLRKSDVEEEFSSAIKGRSEKPVYPFEENEGYVEEMRTRFERLPDVVEPQLPLSLGARAIMLGTMYDRREQVEDYIGDPDAMPELLKMPLFIVFGVGQHEAKEANLENTDSRAILAAYDDFWSVPWPLCCWREYR